MSRTAVNIIRRKSRPAQRPDDASQKHAMDAMRALSKANPAKPTAIPGKPHNRKRAARARARDRTVVVPNGLQHILRVRRGECECEHPCGECFLRVSLFLQYLRVACDVLRTFDLSHCLGCVLHGACCLYRRICGGQQLSACLVTAALNRP